jgi:FAD/FMN-containing dehydrogenase
VEYAYSSFAIIPEPTCIVFPQNDSDVSVAMKAIYNSGSHYAVRGGGHSAMPGWNTYVPY